MCLLRLCFAAQLPFYTRRSRHVDRLKPVHNKVKTGCVPSKAGRGNIELPHLDLNTVFLNAGLRETICM